METCAQVTLLDLALKCDTPLSSPQLLVQCQYRLISILDRLRNGGTWKAKKTEKTDEEDDHEDPMKGEDTNVSERYLYHWEYVIQAQSVGELRSYLKLFAPCLRISGFPEQFHSVLSDYFRAYLDYLRDQRNWQAVEEVSDRLLTVVEGKRRERRKTRRSLFTRQATIRPQDETKLWREAAHPRCKGNRRDVDFNRLSEIEEIEEDDEVSDMVPDVSGEGSDTAFVNDGPPEVSLAQWDASEGSSIEEDMPLVRGGPVERGLRADQDLDNDVIMTPRGLISSWRQRVERKYLGLLAGRRLREEIFKEEEATGWDGKLDSRKPASGRKADIRPRAKHWQLPPSLVNKKGDASSVDEEQELEREEEEEEDATTSPLRKKRVVNGLWEAKRKSLLQLDGNFQAADARDEQEKSEESLPEEVGDEANTANEEASKTIEVVHLSPETPALPPFDVMVYPIDTSAGQASISPVASEPISDLSPPSLPPPSPTYDSQSECPPISFLPTILRSSQILVPAAEWPVLCLVTRLSEATMSRYAVSLPKVPGLQYMPRTRQWRTHTTRHGALELKCFSVARHGFLGARDEAVRNLALGEDLRDNDRERIACALVPMEYDEELEMISEADVWENMLGGHLRGRTVSKDCDETCEADRWNGGRHQLGDVGGQVSWSFSALSESCSGRGATGLGNAKGGDVMYINSNDNSQSRSSSSHLEPFTVTRGDGRNTPSDAKAYPQVAYDWSTNEGCSAARFPDAGSPGSCLPIGWCSHRKTGRRLDKARGTSFLAAEPYGPPRVTPLLDNSNSQSSQSDGNADESCQRPDSRWNNPQGFTVDRKVDNKRVGNLKYDYCVNILSSGRSTATTVAYNNCGLGAPFKSHVDLCNSKVPYY